LKLRILSADDVTRLLPMREWIEVMERALAAFARGEVVQPVRLMTRTADESGVLALMPAASELTCLAAGRTGANGRRPHRSLQCASV
jgi:ornithine cyclodeaminase/alanine dehydrogenase-like protein (mu-crystallin family)